VHGNCVQLTQRRTWIANPVGTAVSLYSSSSFALEAC
jgi:hypothetical protein